MNTLLKSLIAGTALIAATSQAGVVVTFDSGTAAAESAFTSKLTNKVTENFDALGTNPQYVTTGSLTHKEQWSWENHASSFVTNVGTFKLVTAGQGPVAGDNVNNKELNIESANTGEYGRESLSTHDGDLWLDSNDAKLVTWTFGAPLAGEFNAFGFYIADATDRGATLTLKFKDGTSSTTQITIPAFQANGNLGYVSIVSSESILGGVLSFVNSTGADGWGIDDITVGYVPEPGALMLMGLGLLGLGAARRRTNA